VTDIGELLNVVRIPSECPDCREWSQMSVHERAARWECGHERALPPLPHQKMRPWLVRRE
jgi:ribosomal protein S27AE